MRHKKFIHSFVSALKKVHIQVCMNGREKTDTYWNLRLLVISVYPEFIYAIGIWFFSLSCRSLSHHFFFLSSLVSRMSAPVYLWRWSIVFAFQCVLCVLTWICLFVLPLYVCAWLSVRSICGPQLFGINEWTVNREKKNKSRLLFIH